MAVLSRPVGVLGGSGLYELLDDATPEVVTTPYGEPSGPVVHGTIDGRDVAFLPRHGAGHRRPAHLVNYRANVWALRAVGARRVLAPGAVGSLQPHLGPGTAVVCDQLVDRTWGRAHTYADEGGAVHVGFADPFCPTLRAALLRAAGTGVVDGGTMVVVNGPRFSTRAESQAHTASGWAVVGMTGMPEAALAREQALCYASVSMVTDLDAGLRSGTGVTQAEVLAVFARNVEVVRALVLRAAADVDPEQDGCPCSQALDGIDLTYSLAGGPEAT